MSLDGIVSNYGSNTPVTKGNSALGKDEFMNLMIAQLKYQDPMSPMDGSQFASQLAQFSSLEQLSNLNDQMTQSIDANYYLTQSINNTLTATLVGKDVKLSGNEITNLGQTNLTLGYKLPADGSAVSIKIYNEQGSLIKTIDSLPITKGEHKLSWDFTDNNGVRVPEGKYTFEIDAKAANTEKMTAETFKIGKIDALRFTDQGSKLIVDGVEYNLADILEILNSSGSGGSTSG